MSPDRNEERFEEALSRASSVVALLDAGVDVDAEDIQRAALIELPPAAVRAAFNVACLTLVQIDTLAAILAGACSDERIAMFATLGPVVSAPKALPPHRPRRPRRTAADRAQQWLNGPAWRIVDPAEPMEGP